MYGISDRATSLLCRLAVDVAAMYPERHIALGTHWDQGIVRSFLLTKITLWHHGFLLGIIGEIFLYTRIRAAMHVNPHQSANVKSPKFI